VAQAPQWRLMDAWPCGVLYVLEAIWHRLGIPEVIAQQLTCRKVDLLSNGRSLPWWPTELVRPFQALL